ncbi:MAG: carbohydrate binding family 9 domain-containing protein [Acidobacteria bacterium]|nr:carbohydrate binding family 9 domain-containing protein [Acidobacteriota bacterium]
MIRKHCFLERRALSALLLCLLVPFVSQAQNIGDGTGTHGKRKLKAVRTELPVTLDGSLEEPAWKNTPVALGFTQKEPHEGEESTEGTEVRVLYTASTLYIGVICYDSQADRILATERRRDNNLGNDDTISVVLDTFHDHRNAYLFRTNPLGTQYDALITDEGNNINENWDEKWDVVSQITLVGWTAEFAIPFKSLRLNENEGQIWGFDLERVIRRKNELTFWNGFRRGFKLENVSQGGHLEGLENIQSGMRFRVKPFLLGGFQRSSNQFHSRLGGTSDFGMEVMKYRITPSLTADLTWNTDFAQTEVDDQQVNLDRFPLFYPEKREFFQEGAGIFEFGLVRAETATDMKLFHSRTIGLSPERLPVPMTAGARLTGNLGGFTLGLLNVQTDQEESKAVPESNYSVVRVKRNLLSRSNVGGFILNRESAGKGDFNRVYGFDTNFTFYKYLSVTALWAKSDQPGIKEKNWVSSGTAKWDSDFWLASLEYIFIEPNFRDDLGFVPRKNMRRFTPILGISPRPRSGPIRQIGLQARFDYITDRDWKLESRRNHYTIRVELQSGDSFSVLPHWRFERLAKPFTLRDQAVKIAPGVTVRKPLVVVPPGEYSWWYSRFQYAANPARRLSGNVSVEPSPGYFGGDLVEWNINPKLRLTNTLSVELGYTINDASFSQTNFTDHVVNFRVNYAFNNQWLTSTTLQYNSADSFSGINFRLNYIFRPGDDFFFVYNEGRQLGGLFDGQRDRSLQVKLTYSFDF